MSDSTPVLPTPLDPRFLTTDASLNRAIIAALPGVNVESGILGRRVYELVSTAYVYDQLCTHAEALEIPAECLIPGSVEPFIRLDRAFESEWPSVREAAHQIAHTFGCNLAYLLLMLRRGDPENRAVRPEWGDDYWRYWANVPRIWLAGGLIRGHLRDHLLEEIARVFEEAHSPLPDVRLDTHGAHLPLIGAALCVPAGYRRGLALDFGGTQIKAGLATYHDNALIRLETRPPQETRYSFEGDDATLRTFLDRMTAISADALRETGADCPVVPTVIAAYIDPDGNPRDGSLFTRLRRVAPDLQTVLSEEISRALGRAIRVRMLHDGTSAATVYPGDVVITLGTAIAVGMAPAVEQPLERAAHFRLEA